jgi:hypothetical protein
MTYSHTIKGRVSYEEKPKDIIRREELKGQLKLGIFSDD